MVGNHVATELKDLNDILSTTDNKIIQTLHLEA